MIEQWQELKETITELRDNDGTGTQQEVCKFLVNYMGVLEKQMQGPCDDAISRQAALNSLIDNTHLDGYDLAEALDAIENKEKLPPVTVMHKSGKWNEYYTSQKGNDVFNCKECGHTFVVTQGKDNMNYCPNCGCRMVEPREVVDSLVKVSQG